MPITILRAGLVAGAAFLVAACGPRAHCLGEHPYQEAETVEVLGNVEGVRVPRSPSALEIPEAAPDGGEYATFYEDDDGDRRVRCLDDPPQLAPLVEGEPEGDDPA